MSAQDKNVQGTSQERTVVTTTVLSQEAYKSLEKQALSRITIRDESGPVQAGYLAGVHDTLRILRDGFTKSA
jgi:hypothetical protein